MPVDRALVPAPHARLPRSRAVPARLRHPSARPAPRDPRRFRSVCRSPHDGAAGHERSAHRRRRLGLRRCRQAGSCRTRPRAAAAVPRHGGV